MKARHNAHRTTPPAVPRPDLGPLFEQSPDAMVLADPRTGAIVDANRAAEQMIGRSRAALRGRHYTSLAPRDHSGLTRAAFARHARNGGGTDELELLRADGSRLPVDVSSSMIACGGRRLMAGVFRDVSLRRRHEEAIRASERHYRQLADSITDVFFEMDRKLRYTYWNKASEQFTGIAADKAMGRSIFELFPDTPAVRRAVRVYRSVLRTQRPRTFVNEYRTADCEAVEISAYPSDNGVAVFVRDITRRRRMEQSLADSEECYRSVVRNVPVVSFVLNAKGVFTLSEGKGLAKLGIKPGQVVGLSVFDLYRDRPDILRDMRTALAGTPVRNEVQFNHAVYDVSYTPVKDKRRRVAKVIGLAVDITERRKAQAALLNEHNLYMDLVASLPAGVYRLRITRQKAWKAREWVGRVGTNYHLDLVSDLFCKFLGAPRERFEASATTVVECLHPDDRDDFTRRNVAALKNMRAFVWEGRVRNPGPTEWVRFLSVPRRMPDGEVIWTGVLLDITEERRIRKALQASHHDLEDRVRERTARLRALAAQLTQVEHKERRRIAEILHEDIQQRLAGIMFIIQGIVDTGQGRLDAKVAAQLLAQLSEAIQTMRDLTTRFRPPALYELGLCPALDWLAGQMRERFGLAVDTAGLNDVRVDDHDTRLFAYHAVSELLMNVVKHAGTRRAAIRTRLTGTTGFAIDVTDRGCGFDPATAHRAASFGLFSIAERVADFGGCFEIKTRPGRGTRATLWLPLPGSAAPTPAAP